MRSPFKDFGNNDHLTTRVYEIYKNGIHMKSHLNMFRYSDVERRWLVYWIR